MDMKFYYCKKCGKMLAAANDVDTDTVCCGEVMDVILPGTTDAAQEKHVPEYTVADGKVDVVVGAVEHPMLDAHYIEWVIVQTNCGNQRKFLKPGQAPKVSFLIGPDEEVEAVYAYCNLHGLWKK